MTENGYEHVDLGLPSGAMWATCNVGATKPEDEVQKYASLILKISSFEPFYIKNNKVIKNNNLFNLRLYKEDDENNPISCFNGKDYYNIGFGSYVLNKVLKWKEEYFN